MGEDDFDPMEHWRRLVADLATPPTWREGELGPFYWLFVPPPRPKNELDRGDERRRLAALVISETVALACSDDPADLERLRGLAAVAARTARPQDSVQDRIARAHELLERWVRWHRSRAGGPHYEKLMADPERLAFFLQNGEARWRTVLARFDRKFMPEGLDLPERLALRERSRAAFADWFRRMRRDRRVGASALLGDLGTLFGAFGWADPGVSAHGRIAAALRDVKKRPPAEQKSRRAKSRKRPVRKRK